MIKYIIRIIRKIIGTENIKNEIQTINFDLQYIKNELHELKKGMIFNNSIIDCEWLKYKNFSPGYWACDYACLYTLFRVLNDMRPKSILEFGLGQSSKLIQQYANYFNDVDAITCEHDTQWINFFNKHQNKDYKMNIVHFEIEEVIYKNKKTLTYKNLINNIGGGGVYMILSSLMVLMALIITLDLK